MNRYGTPETYISIAPQKMLNGKQKDIVVYATCYDSIYFSKGISTTLQSLGYGSCILFTIHSNFI